MRAGPLALAVCAIIVVAGVSFYAGGVLDRVTLTSTTTVVSTATSSQTGISTYSVCFSPGGNCATQIAAVIASANVSIHMMIYTFTNTALATALVQAEQRGVDVKIVMDGSEAASDNLAVEAVLNQGGVPLRIYSPPNGIVHDKVAIVDGKIVITGSYNWSYSANDYNDENLLILHSTTLASQYEADFQTVWNLAGNSTAG